MSDNKKNLYYLEELPDYKVASDNYDVRGWDVSDNENRTIGKVTSLLVNKQDERVVYLDVEVNKALIEVGYKTYQTPASDGVHGFINKDKEDHLIVPIGMVSLDIKQKKVLTRQINYSTFAKAKRCNKGAPIYRADELVMLNHYGGYDVVDIILEENFYQRKEFANSLKKH